MSRSTEKIEKYLYITKSNLKHNYFQHLALAVAFMIITSILFGISNLDRKASLGVLETFVSIMGVILLTPVFAPEQSYEIYDLVKSKSFSYVEVCIVRLLYLLLTLIILISLFGVMMCMLNCEILIKDIIGTIISSVFLGSLGILVYSLSNNIIISYLIPLAYYLINALSIDKIEYINLFTLSYKNSFIEKYYLIVASVFIISIAYIYKHFKKC